jgi:hypothetical protein
LRRRAALRYVSGVTSLPGEPEDIHG